MTTSQQTKNSECSDIFEVIRVKILVTDLADLELKVLVKMFLWGGW